MHFTAIPYSCHPLPYSVSSPVDELATLEERGACADPFANEGDSYFTETPHVSRWALDDVSTWNSYVLSVRALS
jgi:hypothetical protein